MPKFIEYLKFMGVPDSTIKALESEEEIEVQELAESDLDSIGKVYVSKNPPKNDDAKIAAKKIKAGIYKVLKEEGIDIPLTRTEVEDMPNDEFSTKLKGYISAHNSTLKTATSEEFTTKIKGLTTDLLKAQDEAERITIESENKVKEMETSLVTRQNNAALQIRLANLDKETKWGISGTAKERVYKTIENDILAMGVMIGENDTITKADNMPVTMPGTNKVVRNLKELYDGLTKDFLPVSNGGAGSGGSQVNVDIPATATNAQRMAALIAD